MSCPPSVADCSKFLEERNGKPYTRVGLTLREVALSWEKSHADPESVQGISQFLNEIGVAAKIISNNLQRAELAHVLGKTNSVNVQGEAVSMMDELSNDVVLFRVLNSGLCCAAVTEEETDMRVPPEGVHSGRFVIAVDPLDGSSNIDCNVPTGTIFSIFSRKSALNTPALHSDVLRPGREMISAGYILYGPAILYVVSLGNGVHVFTYDMAIGEFILTKPNVMMPSVCKCFSTNEGNFNYWSKGDLDFIKYCKEEDKATHRPMVGRYVGSLVADFHRNLLYGGVYTYPKDSKDPKKPNGKLRLLYECAPLSFLSEQAGGAGSDGTQRILDIIPDNFHMRTPLYIGTKHVVEKAVEMLSKN
eukprot:GCRY01000815.1.p1 GENE.GCRY01000815.1~~GCRY01000815.1.p1  ORF type:complete len:361 (-),score=66.45 GCRY01000815.1:21-1103(-)